MPTLDAQLLRDKLQLWQEASTTGSMETRDYNRRCAKALKDLLEVAARAADFVEKNDPFGDHFSQYDVATLRQQPLPSYPTDCPICGGDCSAANPPVYNCPYQDDRP